MIALAWGRSSAGVMQGATVVLPGKPAPKPSTGSFAFREEVWAALAVVAVLAACKRWPVAQDQSSRTKIAEPGTTTKVYSAALQAAAAADDVAALLAALEDPAVDPSQAGAWGVTPLHAAAAAGALRTAEALVGRGAAAVGEAWGQTPLHMAAREGHLEVVRVLAAAGDLDAVDDSGSTALALAGAGGHAAVVDYLLEQGATMGGVADDEVPGVVVRALVGRLVGAQ